MSVHDEPEDASSGRSIKFNIYKAEEKKPAKKKGYWRIGRKDNVLVFVELQLQACLSV